LSGNAILKEYAAVGVTPKIISQTVSDYLKSIGDDYTYEVAEITSTSTLKISPILRSAVTVFQSMTIEDDLTINLFIEKSEMDNKIQLIRVNDVRIMSSACTLVEINGVSYYKYKVSSFVPANACDEIGVVIERIDGRTQSFSISVVSYLESLLAVSDDDNEKILAVKLLKYIQSAYSYFKPSKLAEYGRVTGLIEKYASYDLIFGNFKDEYTATGIIKDTISSVRLNLSGSMRMRFSLNPSYSGELTIVFNGETTKYNVKNGKVNGLDYIEVVMPASTINEQIVLSNSRQSLSYGLSSYITSMNNSDDTLNNLLISLSEYSSAAKVYKDSRS
jgi:hypothetical protein